MSSENEWIIRVDRMIKTGMFKWFCFAMLACFFLLADAASEGNTPWKDEFERICSQTLIATTLTTDQLQKLINDSDTLLIQLNSLDDPWAKVYILRLKKCREFFVYAIEWQEKELQVKP